MYIIKRHILTGKLRQNHGRGSGTILANSAYGHSQKGAHMQRKLREILRNQRDHSGIVRARGDFAENDFIATDEEFNAEQAMTA
ncbi:Uncharacterised protein [Salmonella enterica subsp. enterica serovar Bovismorbificans]|uniref:Uncharacterized protein n=1 Tax=Salmonella enterica subsp. enterica serovar Bovismorbificans TaxID=58097 RepID=A0A655ED09_SALET|nr:Uncharacterised protein [Salmonella enterica subsp. enterica serovar Bovismorbificans]